MVERKDKRTFVPHNVIEPLNFPALPDAFCCYLASLQSFSGLFLSLVVEGGSIRTLETAFSGHPCQLIAGSFYQLQVTGTGLNGGKRED